MKNDRVFIQIVDRDVPFEVVARKAGHKVKIGSTAGKWLKVQELTRNDVIVSTALFQSIHVLAVVEKPSGRPPQKKKAATQPALLTMPGSAPGIAGLA